MLIFERLGDGIGILQPQPSGCRLEREGERDIDALLGPRLFLVQLTAEINAFEPLVEPHAQSDLRELLRRRLAGELAEDRAVGLRDPHRLLTVVGEPRGRQALEIGADGMAAFTAGDVDQFAQTILALGVNQLAAGLLVQDGFQPAGRGVNRHPVELILHLALGEGDGICASLRLEQFSIGAIADRGQLSGDKATAPFGQRLAGNLALGLHVLHGGGLIGRNHIRTRPGQRIEHQQVGSRHHRRELGHARGEQLPRRRVGLERKRALHSPLLDSLLRCRR